MAMFVKLWVATPKGSPEYFVGSLYYWNSALEIPELKCVENILILGWK